MKKTSNSRPSSETASTTSSCGGDGKHQLQRAKLNAFLEECNMELLGRRWMEWHQESERTQERYVKRSSEIVKSVLSVVYPHNAAHVWKEFKVSSTMDTIMGVDSVRLLTDNSYLEALAEAYKNAASWDTRRQVLLIMTGVASYREMSWYIPGLTHYRYTIANLHRMQYGRGIPVPEHVRHVPRLKIDRKQLDHFLAYITSPHLIQDLPFGEKSLTLSSGRVISVPNVIRTMTPQRIAKQYIEYCSETGFEPFSEQTMLRILSKCSASVCKSLQGLDYIAAEGTKALMSYLSLFTRQPVLGFQGQVYKRTLKLQNCTLKSTTR